MQRGRATDARPLYIRMYFQSHLTDLVRLIGEGRLEAEAKEDFQALVEKYGEAKMKAAAEEIAERVPGQEPPVVRLTAHARHLAIGILGRPTEPPTKEPSEPVVAAEAQPAAIAKDPPQTSSARKPAATKKVADKKSTGAKSSKAKRTPRKPKRTDQVVDEQA